MPSATFHDLEGASVFITGGGSGIGAALTEGFLRQGAKVAFVQRSDATAFCDSMEGLTGTRPLFIPCDITDVEALKAAITQAAEAHGPIGVLVNNAANDQRHVLEETDEAYWDWAQSINLKAYYFACQAVAPGMKAMGGGSIINFSSITYMLGVAGLTSYTTANAGIMGMTRALARELGPNKVRVNSLAPGWVMTDRQQRLWATPDKVAAHVESQCLKEALVPEDITDTVLFLASNSSRMMTAQTLVVDGGSAMTG